MSDVTRTEWYQTADLCASLTINNIMQSQVGKVLDALRDAGFEIEINVTLDRSVQVNPEAK